MLPIMCESKDKKMWNMEELKKQFLNGYPEGELQILMGVSDTGRSSFFEGIFEASKRLHGVSESSKRYEDSKIDHSKLRPVILMDEHLGDALRYNIGHPYKLVTPKDKKKAEHKLKGVDAIRHNQMKSQLARSKTIPDMYKPKVTPPDQPRKIATDVW